MGGLSRTWSNLSCHSAWPPGQRWERTASKCPFFAAVQHYWQHRRRSASALMWVQSDRQAYLEPSSFRISFSLHSSEHQLWTKSSKAHIQRTARGQVRKLSHAIVLHRVMGCSVSGPHVLQS